MSRGASLMSQLLGFAWCFSFGGFHLKLTFCTPFLAAVNCRLVVPSQSAGKQEAGNGCRRDEHCRIALDKGSNVVRHCREIILTDVICRTLYRIRGAMGHAGCFVALL